MAKIWEPVPQFTKVIKDPEWLWKSGGRTPSWGDREPPRPGIPSEKGYTGEGAPDFTTPKTQEAAITPWQKWQPYFEGLGINLRPGGMTATSPASRQRMLPEALQAMMDYFQSLGIPWQDYLDYSQSFMPKTPDVGDRRWMPAYNYRR